jgi:hypothetical protein
MGMSTARNGVTIEVARPISKEVQATLLTMTVSRH